MEKGQNTGVFSFDKPVNHTSGGKGKEKQGRAKREKNRKYANIALLGFILETFLNEEKKMPHGKGLFGGKVFKNSSRYIVCKNTFS